MHKYLPRLFVILSLGLLIGVGISVSYLVTRSSSSSVQPLAAVANPVKDIAGYRSWTKVNKEPQLMPDRAALSCAAPPLATAPKNPHLNRYLTVYVNDLGRKAMLGQMVPNFPEGSVIVKEKLPAKDSDQPELMTVMIKRGKGFSAANGDWEYMVVDGTGTTVTARGNLENCQSCHSGRLGTDYVFRTYLSDEAMKKLK